jgi:hypothetical protein
VIRIARRVLIPRKIKPSTSPSGATAENRTYKVEITPQPAQPWFVVSVLITGLIAFVNLPALVIMSLQRDVMAGQLENMTEQLRAMRSARDQTDKLIAQNIDQVSALRNSADALMSSTRASIFGFVGDESCRLYGNPSVTPVRIEYPEL